MMGNGGEREIFCVLRLIYITASGNVWETNHMRAQACKVCAHKVGSVACTKTGINIKLQLGEKS